jgi:pseudouridine-5'-phosphate glycosidase
LVNLPKAVPNHDTAGQNVEAAIQEALETSNAAEIHGKDVTPFILRSVAAKTSGDSLRR